MFRYSFETLCIRENIQTTLSRIILSLVFMSIIQLYIFKQEVDFNREITSCFLQLLIIDMVCKFYGVVFIKLSNIKY